MKQLLLGLLGLIGLGLNAQSTGETFFSNELIHEIRISSGVPGFWTSLVNNFESAALAEPETSVAYSPANIEIDGTTLNGIGVRIKGAGSYLASPTNKKSFKIDLNRFNLDLGYEGVKKFNLHNSAQDPSLLREVLGFEAFRALGIAAPRTAFTEVYLNDEYMGLYVLVEQVGGGFLDNNFSRDNGNLYKGDELKTNLDDPDTDDREDLIFVINNTPDSNFEEVISALLDVEQYLRALAVETVLMNSTGHLTGLDVDNYYFYYEPRKDLFQFIPWDFTEAWGALLSQGLATLPNTSITPDQLVLAERLLSVDSFREQYLANVCQVMDYYLNGDIYSTINSYSFLISSALFADSKHPYTQAQIENDWANGGEIDGTYRIGLEGFITQRVAQVEAQLADLSFNCNSAINTHLMGDIVINEVMASNDSIGGVADPAGEFGDWVELRNNSDESIDLTDLYLSNDPDFSRKWNFPSENLAAKDYYIIWCDKDINDEGVHSQFNLSAIADDVVLSHKDGAILDIISFGTQTTNESLARKPNGTGNFAPSVYTFNANNDFENGIEENIGSQFSIFPNPTSDFLTIKSDGEIVATRFYSLDGKLLLQGEDAIIDIQIFPAGNYLLVVEFEDGIRGERFTIN